MRGIRGPEASTLRRSDTHCFGLPQEEGRGVMAALEAMTDEVLEHPEVASSMQMMPGSCQWEARDSQRSPNSILNHDT